MVVEAIVFKAGFDCFASSVYKNMILKPIKTCPQICVYCQRNWEIEDVYSPSAALSREKLDVAIQWIADTPEIREALITGGDPLLLSNSKIEYMLRKLSRIEHVERILIGTRTPVTRSAWTTSSRKPHRLFTMTGSTCLIFPCR